MADDRDGNQGQHHDAPLPIRPARIVHLLIGRESGGITSALRQWAPVQQRAGWSHLVLLLAPGPIEAEMHEAGIEAVVAGSGRGLSTIERLLRLRAELTRHSPSIVHAHNPAGQVYAAQAKSAVGYRLVRTIHADWTLEMKHALNLPQQLIWRGLTSRAMRRTDALICIHDHVRQRLPTRFRDRATVLPNGLDPAPFDDPRGSLSPELSAWLGSEETPMVLAVGRWVAIKRWDWLIRAWAAMSPEVRPKLVLVGAGPSEDQLRAVVADHDLEDDVRLEGWVSDVAPLLRRACLTVITSRSETGPLTLLESMAASVPAVATPVGIVEELISDGETGRIIPHPDRADHPSATDAADLAAVISELVGDPERLKEMGQAARGRLSDQYDHRRTARLHAEIYNDLLRMDDD